MTAALTVALVGNPNSGKSTVFNALTGGTVRIGNWPGVTVERKEGAYQYNGTDVCVVDLPGTYSLTAITEQQCLDEKIACEYLFSDQFDVVINVIDATNLERNLYLTSQLLEMGVPVVVALNMMDVADRRSIDIDTGVLAKALGCPVIALSARKNQGLVRLKKTIAMAQGVGTQNAVTYPPLIEEAVADLARSIEGSDAWRIWCARHLLEGDSLAYQRVSSDTIQLLSQWLARIQSELNEEADILTADARYTWAHHIASQCMTRSAQAKMTRSHRLDNFVLNRWLGMPIFLMVMYWMFFFAINFGGAFQEFFDKGSEAIFVTGTRNLLQAWHAPHWLVAVLADGAGRGINTTLTFIPVIGSMFLFLSFLESSGYMSRAAFVVDRVMRLIGLPGKSFVPMIIGFGCNVPAIMAARTLDNKRDRVLTVMMSPFMSCGARLAIYAVFTAAFFPVNGHNVVFGLYLIGILMAVATGLILRKTLLRGEPAHLVMEMPSYHVPRWSVIWQQTWHRLKSFVVKAGQLIVPVCMIMGSLNAIPVTYQQQPTTVLSAVGQMATPLFEPMGIQQDNWPATVGLATGVLAKEVVVATLNTLYSQDERLTKGDRASESVQAGLTSAWQSIAKNIHKLGGMMQNPLASKAADAPLEQNVYGVMFTRFGGTTAAFAYLLFVLLYFPCVSATAAMVRELNRGWAFFSVFWTTSIAYAVAVVFYQVATMSQHVLSSALWVILMVSLFVITLLRLKKTTVQPEVVA